MSGERPYTPAFPVVGVGASAGGLEALTQMLRALPADTGMAFVVVQHLAPTHASMLAEILSRASSMPVSEVQDELAAEPNRVYVIPPGKSMVISHGVLKLLPREEAHGQHRPIDYFFRSLAENHGRKAIGVVLSGTATDGTLGLEEIKAEGGITFAQDDTAQHNSMPRSAVAAGCVDFVLPPDEIAREIARIARHPYVAPAAEAEGSAREPALGTILQLLLRATGVDFTLYKANTVYRRITRRMVLHKMESLEDYARLLQDDAAEVEALYQDILINVTSFFRNPEMFEALKAKVFPKLLQSRARSAPLRVWVLGCSTGEEAYSLAMTFVEFTESRASALPAQIFATDMNDKGIEKARAGVYSKAIEHDVSPQRLRRFFTEVDGSYRINKSLREMCVFARHNVLADPPFSHVDLVSCRNLLIYLEAMPQRRIVPLLHYALKPGGFLILGASETIGSYRDLFEVEDPRHKIYAMKPAAGAIPIGLVAGAQRTRPADLGAGSSRLRKGMSDADMEKEAERILLAKYAPAAVLVDAELEILQFRGDTGPYLAPSPGKASLNLLKMVRKGLFVALRAAVLKAKKNESAVREEGLRVKSGSDNREVNLEVVPVRGNSAGQGGFLVLFEEATRGDRPRGAGEPQAQIHADAPEEEPTAREVSRLTQELAATREHLQSVIEQQEAANEELQSAHEEAQSANEELQSINEELETSKEEIQSTNEELATVNEELQNRNLELGQLNNDLVNLVGSVSMAIVMIGPDLRIRRFTPMAERILNLIPTDVGRPIGDIKLYLTIPDLEPLLAEVIDTVSVKEREVQDRHGRWYSLRLRPYKTLENKIDGAVLVLVDVDLLKHARDYAESVVATVREPLLVLDAEMRVQTASRAFCEAFNVKREEAEGRLLYDLNNGRWNIPELRRLLGEVLPRDNAFDGFVVETEFEGIGRKVMLLNARRVVAESDQSPLILLAIEDVTDRKRLEEALEGRVGELAEADRSKNEFLAMLSHELRNPLAPIQNAAQILRNSNAGSATAKRALDMIDRQILNMTRIVNDLLDVSRITRGTVELRNEMVELATMLMEVAQSNRDEIDARRQELVVSLPTEPIYVEADPVRLEEVFGNLLNNASKFTQAGGRISLTAKVASEEGSLSEEAVVQVRDNGIGIAPEALPHVFDLFMQADRSLARARGGLGIGLTIVKRLVEAQRGRVEALSAGLGKGSEFVVHLPTVRHQDAPANAGTRGVGGPEGDAVGGSPLVSSVARAPFRKRRVLVVDDNVDSAESMAELLRLSGHSVETAHDGAAALETAAASHPDVILLDIGLPGMDGYEVARLLRQQAGTNVRLIAVTGYGRSDDCQLAQQAGFDHHLTKPVSPDVLNELINRFASVPE